MDQNQLKMCNRCNQEKSKEEFFKKTGSHDGLQPMCKVCSQENAKAWKIQNAEKRKIRLAELYPNTKVCHKCSTRKPLTDFSKKASAKDGLQTNCRDCHSTMAKSHYRKNHKRKSSEEKKIAKANKLMKNQIKKLNLTPEAYEQILKSQDYKCKCCHRKSTSFVADIKESADTNISLICKPCSNILKSSWRDVLRVAAVREYLMKK